VVQATPASDRATLAGVPTSSAAGPGQGRLKFSERQRPSRDDAFRSTVIDIPADGPRTLTVTFGADVDRGLRVRLRTVEADFRITMALGLALCVVGLGMRRPLRDRLLAPLRRD
jgi:hypothetical protein